MLSTLAEVRKLHDADVVGDTGIMNSPVPVNGR